MVNTALFSELRVQQKDLEELFGWSHATAWRRWNGKASWTMDEGLRLAAFLSAKAGRRISLEEAFVLRVAA